MNLTHSQPSSDFSLLAAAEHIPGRLRTASYAVFLLAIYTIVERYLGIYHDALGYMLQSVAHLNPVPLADDVFLRYRSQEEFTVFPQLAASTVKLLGVDFTAAALTGLFLTSWVVAATILLNRLQPPVLTWLSVGLVLVIPGWYSGGEVFRYAEPFFTARGLAEALSLAGIAALLASRRVLALGLLASAMVVHPLMAFPALLVVLAFWLPLSTPHRWAAFLSALILGAIAGSYVLGGNSPVIDGEWLEITRWRSDFLFVGAWDSRAWQAAVQSLATLTIALFVLREGDCRRLAKCTLSIALAGLTLAFVASEVLHIKVLLQGQPWRWLWVARFLATALVPLIVLHMWKSGRAGQAAAGLLCAAWLLTDAGSSSDLPPIGAGGILSIASLIVWLCRRHLRNSTAARVRILAGGVICAVGLTFVFASVTTLTTDHSFGRDPAWIQMLTGIIDTPGVAAALVLAAWYLAFTGNTPRSVAAVGIAGITLLLITLPVTVRSWTTTSFDAADRDQFVGWRKLISVDSEVFWPDAPYAAWFLLDRKSYLTVSQAAGTVFSRETTEEISRRAKTISPLVAPGVWYFDPAAQQEKMKTLTPEVLRQLCKDPTLGFVVSRDYAEAPVAVSEWPGKADFIYLYDCAPLRVAP